MPNAPGLEPLTVRSKVTDLTDWAMEVFMLTPDFALVLYQFLQPV